MQKKNGKIQKYVVHIKKIQNMQKYTLKSFRIKT